MSKLESKKLQAALKRIEDAAKAAVKGLNEMTDNSFTDSDFEKQPLDNVGFIVRTLRQGLETAQQNARFEGMDEEQVEALVERERQQELENLQAVVQEKLAKRQSVSEPELESEPDGAPNEDNNSEA